MRIMPPQPQSEPVDVSQLVELALSTMHEAKFPFLATAGTDGHPRVRPVSPVKTEEFTVYVANLRSYGKTAEIAADPRVELCYLSSTHDQVRISGIASELMDRGVIDEIWKSNPLLQRYLGSQDNPELIIYCVEPTRVRFMREWALEYFDVPLETR